MNDTVIRLAQTKFLVEANSFEMMKLHHEFTAKEVAKAEGEKAWKHDNSGVLPEVGRLGGRPVTISIYWATIKGQLVAFWHPTSQVVDHVQIDAYFSRHFHGTWDNGTRRATCDAMNFAHCLQAIDEFNNVNQLDLSHHRPPVF